MKTKGRGPSNIQNPRMTFTQLHKKLEFLRSRNPEQANSNTPITTLFHMPSCVTDRTKPAMTSHIPNNKVTMLENRFCGDSLVTGSVEVVFMIVLSFLSCVNLY